MQHMHTLILIVIETQATQTTVILILGVRGVDYNNNKHQTSTSIICEIINIYRWINFHLEIHVVDFFKGDFQGCGFYFH